MTKRSLFVDGNLITGQQRSSGAVTPQRIIDVLEAQPNHIAGLISS